MKRFFVALSLLTCVSLLRAADLNIHVVGDARPAFEKLMVSDQLKKGMNLVLTTPNGQKIWANMKSDGNGNATFDWVITDMADRVVPSLLIRIASASAGPRFADYPGECYECSKSPDGPASGDPNCHKVPCPVHVPCCKNNHWCCIR